MHFSNIFIGFSLASLGGKYLSSPQNR